MNFNHYLVGALPKLTWDSDLPGTLEKFLDDNWPQLESLMDPLKDLLLQNDIYNIEMVLRSKLPKLQVVADMEPEKPELYSPRYIEWDEIEKFLEDPFANSPDENFPEFMMDYFLNIRDNAERYRNIENLYIAYFGYLQSRESGFLRYYGRVATTIRTVLAAERIRRQGLPLEEHLKGDWSTVQLILENRSSSDLGLKSVFPEIADIIQLFHKSPIDLEHDLDRIRFKLMEEVGQETPFGDHVILSYIIGFQVRDIWNTLNKERGSKILDMIVNG